MTRRVNKESFIGEVVISKQGYEMKIIKYNNARDIVVEFQDKYKAIKSCQYGDFKNKRNIKNPYHPTVLGIGYLGEGKYLTTINGRKTRVYDVWHDMLKRCYDPYYINKELTYIDCYVCSEWLNFQNFAEWYYENYYEIEGQRMHLDKDILVKGNKTYSSATCCFVPQNINSLFVKNKKIRGKIPIGLTLSSSSKFLVQCNIFYFDRNEGVQERFGLFDNIEEGFLMYKKVKESEIKKRAEYFKDCIPTILYNALLNYEVEITD